MYYRCRECGMTEDECQASPEPCCIVCAEFNTSPHEYDWENEGGWVPKDDTPKRKRNR